MTDRGLGAELCEDLWTGSVCRRRWWSAVKAADWLFCSLAEVSKDNLQPLEAPVCRKNSGGCRSSLEVGGASWLPW